MKRKKEKDGKIMNMPTIPTPPQDSVAPAALPNAQKVENVMIPVGLRNAIVEILATKVMSGISFAEMQNILQSLQQAQPVMVTN